MTIAHLLRDFSSSDWSGLGSIGAAPDNSQEDALDAFERGYKDGWDDAFAASLASTTYEIVSSMAAEEGQTP